MGLSITACEIPDVLEIESDIFRDERGYFSEFYNQTALANLAFEHTFIQDNLSRSARGVLRGLHYQLNPHAQGKLVRCVLGSIFDVVVDLREGSDTLGKYVARELAAEHGNALWIPPGFAHGFLALEGDSYVMYKCTAPWVAEAERTIRYDDPELNIKWPFDPAFVNKKDSYAPAFAEAEKNFTL
jgi:dTDP-4-dehydrorhamnose 3,5-epimerase